MTPNKKYVPMRCAKYCFVPACKNNCLKDANKIFFSVPTKTKQEWCNAVGITCPKRTLFICDDHLDLKEDLENYQYWITMKGRAKLKSRLPQSLAQTLLKHDLKDNKDCTSTSFLTVEIDMICETESCNSIEVKQEPTDCSTYCTITNIKSEPEIEMIDESLSNEATLPSVQQSFTSDAVNCMNVKTELDRNDLLVEEMQKNEALPSVYGNSTSANVSEISAEVNTETVHSGRTFMLNHIKKKPLLYIGLPKKYYWLIKYLEIKLGIRSFNIIITLFKVKNNTPFYQIADMFEMSLSTLWRIFFTMLCSLSRFFKQLVFTPSSFEVKKNLPSIFKTNEEYSNVFCIIYSFEVEIEKPSDLTHQSLTWSQYKNNHSLKYLLAATPDGFVNYVSAGFGGSISDVSLVERSGILDVLPPNCTIMAERGFKHIDTVLSGKQIKILWLPSVDNSNTGLQEHVDRTMRRLRLFRLLSPNSVISNKLIQYSDEVVVVACGLINLQNSMRSE